MNVSYYDILGVPPAASRDEIRAAWRDAADRFEPGSGGSSAQFRLFNDAAETLLDPERRKEYDAQLGAASRAEPASSVESVATSASAGGGTGLPLTHERTQKPKMPKQPRTPKAGRTNAAGSGGGIPTAALAVLGVLAAVAVGLAAYFGFQAQRAEAYEQALGQAPAAAERAAVAVLAYDYETLEADRDAAVRFLTDSYADEYAETFDATAKRGAPQLKAKVEAEVLASSAMHETGDNRDPDQIRVLMFVNQRTLSTANPEPQLALNRVVFDMVDVEGTWLVDDITSY